MDGNACKSGYWLFLAYYGLFPAYSVSGSMARWREADRSSLGMTAFTESIVEDAALAWLASLGYAVLHGPAIAVGEPAAERHPIYTRFAYIRNLRIIAT